MKVTVGVLTDATQGPAQRFVFFDSRRGKERLAALITEAGADEYVETEEVEVIGFYDDYELPFGMGKHYVDAEPLEFEDASLRPLNGAAKYRQTEEALDFLLGESQPDEFIRMMFAARALYREYRGKGVPTPEEEQPIDMERRIWAGAALDTAIVWERG